MLTSFHIAAALASDRQLRLEADARNWRLARLARRAKRASQTSTTTGAAPTPLRPRSQPTPPAEPLHSDCCDRPADRTAVGSGQPAGSHTDGGETWTLVQWMDVTRR